MVRILIAGLAIACISLIANCNAEDLASSAITRLGNDNRFLSSDELSGRRAGSEHIAVAANYIVSQLVEAGVDVATFGELPFQKFTIPGPAALGPREQNRLSFSHASGGSHELAEEFFRPVSIGKNGKFEGELAFLGYGITANELGYDDYAKMDVAGKVVIVLRKEPQQNDPNSRFNGLENTEYAYFSTKEINASLKGASALILVNDAETASSNGDELLGINDAGKSWTDNKVPTIYCKRQIIDDLIQRSIGKTLGELEATIDKTGEPASQLLTGLQVQGEVLIKDSQIPVKNIVGFIPGRGSLAGEYVVIGAHYDHVGMGGEGSLAPGTIEVHNGADDNASGTTVLIEVARRMAIEASDNSTQPRRNVVVIAFTAEELGLLGSKYYVRHPRWPLEHTIAMINMDMVGRLRDNTLTVYGTGTAVGFDSLVDRANAGIGFVLDKIPAGFGPSDHASFYEVGIPVFHLFTGLHSDYHRPGDDFEKVNVDGMAKIADFTTTLLNQLVTSDSRPQAIKSSAVANIINPRGMGQSSSRQSDRKKATLGVSLTLLPDQVVIRSTVVGQSAEQAGLLPGDAIVEVDGKSVDSLSTLRQALARLSPGDQTTVTVLRNGERLQTSVTLGPSEISR